MPRRADTTKKSFDTVKLKLTLPNPKGNLESAQAAESTSDTFPHLCDFCTCRRSDVASWLHFNYTNPVLLSLSKTIKKEFDTQVFWQI